MRISEIFLIIIVINVSSIKCGTLTERESLSTNLLTSYSTDIRPMYYQNNTLNITVEFYLFSIYEFNEIDGIISLVAAPQLYWNDYRLAWHPANYGDINEIVIPKSKIWVPDIFLLNPAQKMEPIGDDNIHPRVTWEGLVSWLGGSIIKSSCSVDMTNFPFDSQTCDSILAAWNYWPNEVILSPLATSMIFTYYSENQMWKIKSTSISRYTLGGYSGFLQVKIELERKPLYFSLNILAPIILLCILNPLVFLLPVDSGEKISYAVTIFLSFAVFMTLISDTMPKVSEPMSRLSYMILASMAYSTLICIITILVVKMYHTEDDCEIPRWLKGFYRLIHTSCRKRCKSKRNMRQINVQKDSEGKNSTNDDMPGFEHQKDFTEIADCGKKEDITWKKIACTVDKACFIASIFFVLLFCVATVVLLLVR